MAAQAGIQPATSAILIDKGSNEATIDLKNTGQENVLLYSKVNKLPDDDLAGGVLYTVPQVVLVAPGATQTVRVIYRSNGTLAHEHLARVIFSGLPPIDQKREGKVKLVIGQDLPVVVGVDRSTQEVDIWKAVRLRQAGSQLCLKNPTRKVFRFEPQLKPKDGKPGVAFAKPYLLPNEELCQPMDAPLPAGTVFMLNSVSSFNYALGTHEITLDAGAITH